MVNKAYNPLRIKMSRRFSVTSVLDVSELNKYYGRLDVYVSFTDDGDYDYFGGVDATIRPESVYGYPINDVVGRFTRESTLYGRVFRYKEKSREPLDVTQYRMDDYEIDYRKLVDLYPAYEDELDWIYSLVPGQLKIKNAFNHLWQLTFRLAAKQAKGITNIKKQWADIFIALGYDAILDKRGTGVINDKRKAVLLVLGRDDTHIEDLEIVSTQEHKKELNQRIYRKIARFNRLTKVSNARNRIAKW